MSILAAPPNVGVPMLAVEWLVAAAANLLSTGVGLPVAWLGPDARLWHIVLAALLLLVPCSFASVWSERWLLRKSWPDRDRTAIACAVLRANLWSYTTLMPLGVLSQFLFA